VPAEFETEAGAFFRERCYTHAVSASASNYTDDYLTAAFALSFTVNRGCQLYRKLAPMRFAADQPNDVLYGTLRYRS